MYWLIYSSSLIRCYVQVLGLRINYNIILKWSCDYKRSNKGVGYSMSIIIIVIGSNTNNNVVIIVVLINISYNCSKIYASLLKHVIISILLTSFNFQEAHLHGNVEGTPFIGFWLMICYFYCQSHICELTVLQLHNQDTHILRCKPPYLYVFLVWTSFNSVS